MAAKRLQALRTAPSGARSLSLVRCLRPALAIAAAVAVSAAAAADEPGPAAEPGVIITRLSVKLQPVGSGVSQRQMDRALEDTPARRDANERMAAVLAGEVSLYEARKLHGQPRIDFLEQAARRGDAAACSAIGDILDSGDGVAADPARAIGYFRAGALGGRMDAAHNLGAAYARGDGGKVDFTEALAWVIIARERGDRSGAEAQLRQHLLGRGRTEEIAAAQRRAAALHTRLAPEEVVALLPPVAPITFDERRAIAAGDETNTVAGDGDPAGPPVVVMTILGERRSWPSLPALERAANRGDAAAMGSFGRLLTNGKLMSPDPLRAVVWLERSAGLGDVDAAQQLGDLYSKGQGIVVDDAKAFRFYLQAARGGSALAMASVGIFFTNGRGTPRDVVQGLAWLIAAKQRGVDLGQEARLRGFLARQQPEDVTRAEQLAATLPGGAVAGPAR